MAALQEISFLPPRIPEIPLQDNPPSTEATVALHGFACTYERLLQDADRAAEYEAYGDAAIFENRIDELVTKNPGLLEQYVAVRGHNGIEYDQE